MFLINSTYAYSFFPEKNTRTISHTQATSITIQKTSQGVMNGTSPRMEATINRISNPRAALHGLSLSAI